MNTTEPMRGDEGLRHDIHMAMLAKSESAKDCGEITVVPLGFAVDVALQEVIRARKDEAEMAHEAWTKTLNDFDFYTMIINRIAQLNQQIERSDSE